MAVLTVIIEVLVWLVSSVVLAILVLAAFLGGAITIADGRIAVRFRLEDALLSRHTALRR